MLTYVLIQVCLIKIDFKRLRKFGLRVKKHWLNLMMIEKLTQYTVSAIIKNSGKF